MGELLKKNRQADVCVIGGGLAGICAAIAAARTGAKVVLMQDRPMLGGNASSEIRMWVSGAGSRVRNLQETGIMEEILLENMYRNPTRNFSIWDSILYEKVKAEENIELLLNCASIKAVMLSCSWAFNLLYSTPLHIGCSSLTIFSICSLNLILSSPEYIVGVTIVTCSTPEVNNFLHNLIE